MAQKVYVCPRSTGQNSLQGSRLKKVSSFNKLQKGNTGSQSLNTSTGSDIPISQIQKKSNHPNISDFTEIKLLGRGVFGKVVLAIHNKSGFVCAIKIIDKQYLKGKDEEDTMKIKNQLVRQIKIQSFMDHPNIIKLYSVFDDERRIYLMMQAATDGQLYSILKHINHFREQTTSFILKQILLGVNYMHNHEIIHRDIKPENIIVTYGTIKICDFGWSVYCSKNIRSTVCGTPLYFSPQLLKGKQYDEKIDAWALGILTHEMVTGQNPFNIRKRSQITKIITDQFVMDKGSQSLRDFITKALVKDPEKRTQIKEMLNHPFIIKYQGMDFAQQLTRFF